MTLVWSCFKIILFISTYIFVKFEARETLICHENFLKERHIWHKQVRGEGKIEEVLLYMGKRLWFVSSFFSAENT